MVSVSYTSQFERFTCPGGLNPSTVTWNETVFVICANVPLPDRTTNDAAVIGGILGGSLGFVILVLLLRMVYERRRENQFRQSIEKTNQETLYRHLEHIRHPQTAVDVEVHPVPLGVPGPNVTPLTPEEAARLQV